MALLGQMNFLTVVKAVDFGIYLDGAEFGEVLLPKRYLPAGKTKAGDSLNVFLYRDSEDRVIATTEIPKVMVGQCAALRVLAVNDIGAFLDWGLSKDLLLPFSEQINRPSVGEDCVVMVFIDDNSHRIAGSARLDEFLEEENDGSLKTREAVDLLIVGPTPLGYKAVINGKFLGVIYKSEVAKPLKVGDKLKGFIKKPREDGKIDLSVTQLNDAARDDLASQIIQHLSENAGFSKLTDKSPPDAIYAQYKTSKGNYKKAIGGLFKKKQIRIEKGGIYLAEEAAESE